MSILGLMIAGSGGGPEHNFFNAAPANFFIKASGSDPKISNSNIVHQRTYGGSQNFVGIWNGKILDNWSSNYYYGSCYQRPLTFKYPRDIYPNDYFKGELFGWPYGYRYISSGFYSTFGTRPVRYDDSNIRLYTFNYYGDTLYQTNLYEGSSYLYYLNNNNTYSTSTGFTYKYGSRWPYTPDGLTFYWMDNNYYTYKTVYTGTAYQLNTFTLSSATVTNSTRFRGGISGSSYYVNWFNFENNGNRINVAPTTNLESPFLIQYNLSTAYNTSDSNITGYTSRTLGNKISGTTSYFMGGIEEYNARTLNNDNDGGFILQTADTTSDYYMSADQVWITKMYYSTDKSNILLNTVDHLKEFNSDALACSDWGRSHISYTNTSFAASVRDIVPVGESVLGFCFNSDGSQIWVLIRGGYGSLNGLQFDQSYFGFKVYNLTTNWQVETDLASNYVGIYTLPSAEINNIVANNWDARPMPVWMQSNGSKIFGITRSSTSGDKVLRSFTLTLTTTDNILNGGSWNWRDLSGEAQLNNYSHPVAMDLQHNDYSRGFILFSHGKVLELDFATPLDNSTLTFSGSYFLATPAGLYGLSGSYYNPMMINNNGTKLYTVDGFNAIEISLNTAYDFSGGYTKTVYATNNSYNWFQKAKQLMNSKLYMNSYYWQFVTSSHIKYMAFADGGTSLYLNIVYNSSYTWGAGIIQIYLSTPYDPTSITTNGSSDGQGVSMRGRGYNDSNYNSPSGASVYSSSQNYASTQGQVRVSKDGDKLFFRQRYNDFIYRIVEIGLDSPYGKSGLNYWHVNRVRKISGSTSSSTYYSPEYFNFIPDASNNADRIFNYSTSADWDVFTKRPGAADIDNLPVSTSSYTPDIYGGVYGRYLSSLSNLMIAQSNDFANVNTNDIFLFNPGASNYIVRINKNSSSSYAKNWDHGTSTTVTYDSPSVWYTLGVPDNTFQISNYYANGGSLTFATFNKIDGADITGIQGYIFEDGAGYNYGRWYLWNLNFATSGFDNFTFNKQTYTANIDYTIHYHPDTLISAVNAQWDPEEGKRLTYLDFDTNTIITNVF
jgi:hypothetical protein